MVRTVFWRRTVALFIVPERPPLLSWAVVWPNPVAHPCSKIVCCLTALGLLGLDDDGSKLEL
eukprot:5436428-Pyramimonas_sp.AAC.1